MERIDEELAALAKAAEIGIALPEPCVPGVIDNLRLLESHVARLDRFLVEHTEA